MWGGGEKKWGLLNVLRKKMIRTVIQMGPLNCMFIDNRMSRRNVKVDFASRAE